MLNLSERILGGLELVFWRLTVQLLSFARPFTKTAITHAKDLRNVKLPLKERASLSFGKNIFSALFGWLIGILLGYLLTLWII